MAPEKNTDAVYDASTLGTSKRLLLGVQHLFAMFGATVLVPALTGLDVANALLFAGLGTLLFHLVTGRKIPAFLGSSFAFIGGYNAIRALGTGDETLPYACFGVACAGLVYLVLAFFFKQFGAKKVMRYFPPHCHGPHHHLHRPDPFRLRRDQLLRQLVGCSGCHSDRCLLQHLGQGHGEDHPHPAGCGWLLCVLHDR